MYLIYLNHSEHVSRQLSADKKEKRMYLIYLNHSEHVSRQLSADKKRETDVSDLSEPFGTRIALAFSG